MMTQETRLLVVPHTHWDREWYQTFQQFRLRLVRAVDKVLDVLEQDPQFTYFTLDGQMIVLEDYLEVRPERAEQMRSLARQGRLLVGPWYVQPDEFLVGGEALIRNLQLGMRMAEPYGGAMPIGYVPDTFGHLAQLPQILRGFGLDNAVLWRGVPPEMRQNAFRWVAPDGSEVFVIWLNDESGYSNAAMLPTDPEALAARVRMLAERMRPLTVTNAYLLMNGSDHLEPQEGLGSAVAAADALLREEGCRITLGTLPEYASVIRELVPMLPAYEGELRSSYSAHLLPGVLSSRLWLKQRNAACQALLTRWAEPASAWASALGAAHPATLLHLAWKFLLQNHPHDSICGCGIDQIHAEMQPRFDQCEQIAEELTRVALAHVASQVETRTPGQAVPVVVFNPTGSARSDVVRFEVSLPASHVVVSDAAGRALPHRVLATHEAEIFQQEADTALVASMIGIVSEGRAMGYTVSGVELTLDETPGVVNLDVTVLAEGEPDIAYVERAKERIMEMAARDDIATFRITGRLAPRSEVEVLARDIPAYGGQTIFVRPTELELGEARASAALLSATGTTLENPYLRIEVDAATGTFTLFDRLRSTVYAGLNRIVDGGDVGDLYNYCPPANDWLLGEPCRPPEIELVEDSPLRATLRVSRVYLLPRSCTADRSGRSAEALPCRVTSELSLTPEARRVEVRTTVENTVRDHRLRALFPLPFAASASDADDAFTVTRRPARQTPPPGGASAWEKWIETPVNTHPQQRFVDVSAAGQGLALLNRGLPEYELLPDEDGGEASTLALTLLRCTDWLSRGDLPVRHGHAGPMLRTPGAQELGIHVFEYALVPHSGMWFAEEALVLREAEAFEAPLRAHATDQHAGILPASWSFVRLHPADIVVSAVKRAEHGSGLVIRVYNPRDIAVTAELALALPFHHVRAVNLREEMLPRSAQQAELDHRVTPERQTLLQFALGAGEIRTFLFTGETHHA